MSNHGTAEAQNALGQGIVDAQNYITDQHNKIGEWLHGSLCLIYAAVDGSCSRQIGPLQEDEAFIPVHLHWPEGQPTMIEKLEQMQQNLAVAAPPEMTGGQADKTKIDTLDEKVDNIKTILNEKVEGLDEKIDNIKNILDEKVEGMQTEMKELKEMLSMIVDVIKKE